MNHKEALMQIRTWVDVWSANQAHISPGMQRAMLEDIRQTASISLGLVQTPAQRIAEGLSDARD